jgi:hypothetical protein
MLTPERSLRLRCTGRRFRIIELEKHSMRPQSIISQREALEILRNDLRRAALEKRTAELKDATPGRREEIAAQIERETAKELRKRSFKLGLGIPLH